MDSLNKVIHVATFATYLYTCYYAHFVLYIPMLTDVFKKFDPGQLKYLTIWCLIAQALFFLICILNDWVGTNAVSPKKRPVMRKVKDYFHAAISYPVAMFVGVTFWGLMFVDRELVLPKALDPYFPWWLNHLMHTMIMVSTILEMIVAPREYPKRKNGLGGLITFMLIYLIWLHVIYVKSGVWVYPVMEVLSWPLRVVFFVVLLCFSVVLYISGEQLDNLVWGKRYLAESADRYSPELKT
ncbi:androgen-dependent TFPI-regulating protein-like isoform X4 [Prorops nasuta]|uniref:androgen-dependent TFPI-regulating protein-like isoform X4 n=1 Tax=Prorops nasuta TaxID=863751 RepID=UPI0034CF9338